MKLKINGFENEIVFDGESVNVLDIKDKECFKHILEIIYDLSLENESLEICLISENDDRIDFKDNAIIMFDLFNVDYNSKSILNKLYNIIQENIEKNQDLDIEEYKFIEEINELPFEFEMKDDYKIVDLLKIYGLKIDFSNYDSILNRVELMINIISILKVAKILIIPNLKVYLNDKELLELYKYSLYNNIELLLIEHNSSKKLKYEKVMVIDTDFFDSIIWIELSKITNAVIGRQDLRF